MIYKLDYVLYKRDVNNEIFTLGYFSSTSRLNEAINKYRSLQGFSNNPNLFEITNIDLDILQENNPVYEVVVYYHDPIYDIEHINYLGVFLEKSNATLVLQEYEDCNTNLLISSDLVYEGFINEYKLNDLELSEGFIKD